MVLVLVYFFDGLSEAKMMVEIVMINTCCAVIETCKEDLVSTHEHINQLCRQELTIG